MDIDLIMTKITKAIFPVAGLGTRFLPVTKASPKEMLPIVDKPLIQYAVEEAIDAGITDMIFITGRNKRSIEDHFDKAYELEAELELKQKTAMLDLVRNIIPQHINCIYIRQPQALGLGDAIFCAKPVIGNEPFAIMLADELIDSTPSTLKHMVDMYNSTNTSIIGVEEVDPLKVSSYGIVSIDQNNQITDIIEKPQVGQVSSNLAVIGRYILTPAIFDELKLIKRGVGNEIQLTDAISSLLNKGTPITAHKILGQRYDCGSKLGYLKAMIAYGLKHDEIGQDLQQHLANYPLPNAIKP